MRLDTVITDRAVDAEVRGQHELLMSQEEVRGGGGF